jgi:hypothetical protein
MKKFYKISFAFFILLFGFNISVFAQNLVPNPSFEDTVQCPTDQNQIYYAVGWLEFGMSPDYYNTCATYFQCSIPNHWTGYQLPEPDGTNAYAGLFTKQPPTINVREYIGIKLLDTLIIGKAYDVSFKVSLAYGGNLGINCATNNIGALFSTIPFYYSGMSPAIVKNYAHIYTTQIITDTTNWTTISGSFVADSAYQYIVIGNFFDDTLTSHIKFYDNGYSECASYYFVENVDVTEDTMTGINNIELQNKIKVYPNPAQNFITIEINGKSLNNAQLKIYDLLGIVKDKYPLNKNKEQINISQYPAGFYLLGISTKNKYFYKKLIINK